jgi:hypothetical protein
MKKITEFLKQPFTTTLLCAVGLAGGFAIGTFGTRMLGWHNKELDKNKACNQAYKTMCLQVHACTGSSVEQCDQIVNDEELCKVKLPDLQLIYSCEEQLRHVECTDEMPSSCKLFME